MFIKNLSIPTIIHTLYFDLLILFCILNEYELDRINDNYFRKRKETLRLEGIVFSL